MGTWPPINPTSAMVWWGGATRAGGDEGGAPPGEASDARDAGAVEGLGHGHLGEDRRQAAGQSRCTSPSGAEPWDAEAARPRDLAPPLGLRPGFATVMRIGRFRRRLCAMRFSTWVSIDSLLTAGTLREYCSVVGTVTSVGWIPTVTGSFR
jgi:hypothetical protein